MYLQTLALGHFKCFTRAQLELGKITLLLGANSTGKSSLLNGLLAPLQSDQFPLALSANGFLANLGDFRSISYGHSRDTRIEITLGFREHRLGPVTLRGVFRRSVRTGLPEVDSAAITDPAFSVDVTAGASRSKAEWKYDVNADSFSRSIVSSEESRLFFEALGRLMNDSLRKARASKHAQLKSGTQADDEEPIDPLATPPPTGRFNFTRPNEFFGRLAQPRYVLLSTHLNALSGTLSEFKRHFNFVGSFRLEPQRSYHQVSKGNLKVERDGSNYIEQIATWQEQRAPELNQLKRALRRLKLSDTVRAARLRSGLFEVLVQPHDARMPVSLADVGFGVGQVLPILVADLQLPKASTLAVSQPEIHLHPSAQADLADYLVARTKTAKQRYIIETHSEYLINRLRSLVAEGTVKPEDVSVVYLTTDGRQSTLHPIQFLPSGRIEGAPKDFFQTYMLDVMNIALKSQP